MKQLQEKWVYTFILSFFITTHFQTKSIPIRVLLQTVSPSSSSICKSHTLSFESKKGFIVQTNIKSPIKLNNNEKTLEIMASNGELFVLSQLTKTKKVKGKELTITSKDNHQYLEGKPYAGSITLSITKDNNIQVINTLDLEDYIYSVIPLESFQSWPTEIHKVQAIVSRTYAMYHIIEARKKKRSFDIKNGNFHQTYDGHHDFHHIRDAVDTTHGMLLSYDKKPILAMFDACCGGITPAYMKELDFKKAPCLDRKKVCTYCKNYSLYRWSNNISLKDVSSKLESHSALKNNMKTIGTLKDVCVLEKDKAGIIHKVHIKGSRKNFICTGKQLWEAFKGKMWSQSFHLRKVGSSIHVSGNGFGHQTGLCQRGSHELYKNHNWDYKKILRFYYPGSRFITMRRKV